MKSSRLITTRDEKQIIMSWADEQIEDEGYEMNN